MAWQTPKTDWTGADGVRDADFNRIEENTRVLHDSVSALQTDIVNVQQNIDSRLFEISQRAPISTVVPGGIIGLYENQILVPFIKLFTNYKGTNRALFRRLHAFKMDTLQNAADTAYSGCKTDTWLSNDYIVMLDSVTQAALANVNIDVHTGVSVGTISRKAFLLSTSEYNLASNQLPVEGSANDYATVPSRRIVTFNGAAVAHHTRTISVANNIAGYVTSTGSLGTGSRTDLQAGICPAITLPTDMDVIVGMPSTSNVLATALLVE